MSQRLYYPLRLKTCTLAIRLIQCNILFSIFVKLILHVYSICRSLIGFCGLGCQSESSLAKIFIIFRNSIRQNSKQTERNKHSHKKIIKRTKHFWNTEQMNPMQFFYEQQVNKAYVWVIKQVWEKVSVDLTNDFSSWFTNSMSLKAKRKQQGHAEHTIVQSI